MKINETWNVCCDGTPREEMLGNEFRSTVFNWWQLNSYMNNAKRGKHDTLEKNGPGKVSSMCKIYDCNSIPFMFLLLLTTSRSSFW